MGDEKIKIIPTFCKNKKVLDIGCVSHNANAESDQNWLHSKILEVTDDVTGIDYLKKDVNILVKKGYNMIYANAEKFDLDQKFQVIVAGDLIEHLFNAGSFLDSVKKHMNKNSILIVTTPNAFSIRRMIGSLLLKKLNDNVEHVAFYSNTTIRQLFERKGFKNIEIKYFLSNDTGFKKFIEIILSKIFRKSTMMNLLITAKI